MTRLFTILVLLATSRAGAADDKAACLSAYSNAQDLRASSKLVESSRELRVCARAACPAFVARDCSRWLDEVDAATPTVVFAATLDGRDVAEVSVGVDGVVLAERLDGAAVSLDPGPHEIEFRRGGLEPIRQQVLARMGEKNRAVAAAFVTPPAPEPVHEAALVRRVVTSPPMRAEVVANPWRAAGIGVAGTGATLLIAGGVAGIAAVVTKSDHCVGTTCDPGTVGTLRDQTTVSTATFIAGIVLASAGVTLAVIAKPRHRVVPAALGSLTLRF